MQLLLRNLFDALCVLSLVAFLFFGFLTLQGRPMLLAKRERLRVYLPQWNIAPPRDVFADGWPIKDRLDLKGLDLYFVSVSNGRRTYWNLWVEPWLFAGLTALPPLGRGIEWWRRSRVVPPGCCAVCGYHLRATPQRCPECGAVPVKPA